MKATTGQSETTMKPTFYDITKFVTKMPSPQYGTPYKCVFIVDMPGVAGYETSKVPYLNEFGPGHFDYSFVLGGKITK